jgi:hypothetical protein
MSIKNETRAWAQLDKANSGQLWTSCDLCKTFCLGLLAGLIITFIAVSTIL